MNDLDHHIKLMGKTEELIDRKKLPHEREPWNATLEYIRHGWNDECRIPWWVRLGNLTPRQICRSLRPLVPWVCFLVSMVGTIWLAQAV